MTKRIQAKHKIDRRLGVNLWGSAKSPINKNRTHGPGQHGAQKGKLSDYGIQLRAKQTLKFYYGSVSERQMTKYYKEAIRRQGDTSENLVAILESRLDAVVYRMKFVPTVFASRQFVNHGHIEVNGRKVDIPSYIVKVGDVISVKAKSKELPLVLSAMDSKDREIPDYMDVNASEKTGTYIRTPKLSDIPYPVKMEPNLVVEYYSR